MGTAATETVAGNSWKIVTRCYFWLLYSTKFDFSHGCAPYPAAYDVPRVLVLHKLGGSTSWPGCRRLYTGRRQLVLPPNLCRTSTQCKVLPIFDLGLRTITQFNDLPLQHKILPTSLHSSRQTDSEYLARSDRQTDGWKDVRTTLQLL